MERLHALRLAVGLLLLVGCTFEPQDPQHAGTPKEAEALAGEWLAAVTDATTDRGWSLLHPLSWQRLYANDESLYRADVEAIDWANFRWEVEPTSRWDGYYWVTVRLDGDTRPADVIADGHLMQLFESGDGLRRASIGLRMDLDGTSGVLGPQDRGRRLPQ
ncbi:MAG: hypothetical protein LC744_08015 [Chloroflexi bacterium]|nr:hypothetical protein [Chloroflexota bacterium]